MDATAGDGTFGGTEPVNRVEALRSSSTWSWSSSAQGLGVWGLRVLGHLGVVLTLLFCARDS